MLTVGFDPGTATLGYGFVRLDDGGVLRHVAHGAITTPPEAAPEQRLAMLYDALSSLLREHHPDAAAIEDLFIKNNVTTGIAVAQARGVTLLACAHAGVPVESYAPAQVKRSIVGAGRATKQQVQYMVQTLLGLRQPPRPDDAADGLANAICHLFAAPVASRISRVVRL
ncbi:crossover junction endodeoxyribonuclease RuvC [Candidatus Poribacteria bacterium]|nr:crossover junction endodeoxyribonuclease RuvC [Candidatus Poribacteria bacterium]